MKEQKSYLITGGVVVTMDPSRRIFQGDVLIEGARIKKLGHNLKASVLDAKVIEASGQFVIPGLIQAHTHLCQALFRGYADDLELLDWLKKRIWPMEHAHTPESLKASARIALLEMHKLGTTAILDMGTVRHTEALFEAVNESGMRYWGGKCFMDLKSASGPLYEDTMTSLKEAEELIQNWHRKTELIEYAICPRFAVSCTEKILKASAQLQEKYDCLIHTHASESLEEIALVKKRSGMNNIDYLDDLGLLNENSAIVHGVHMTRGELKKMIRRGAGLVHCPSSNLKLASGIAPTESYREAGLKMGLGSDGAPCNNTMDPFLEMRLAALLQKPRFGPVAMPAQAALEMATLGGAQVLGREKDLGSIEEGKLADVVTVDRSHPSVHGVEDPYSALVYSCSGRDVKNVFVHGHPVVLSGKHQIFNEDDVLNEAREERLKLFSRLPEPPPPVAFARLT